MLPLTLRQKTDSDDRALEDLFRMNRTPEATWLNPDRPPESLAEQCEGETIILAESAGQVVGFVSVWDPDHFIHHLYVHPDHQGRGVGRALVEEVARRYRGPLSLKCVRANQRALDFYLHTGWTEISTGMSPEGEYVLLERTGTAPSQAPRP